MGTNGDGGSWKRRSGWLALLVGAVYWRALGAGFIWDDPGHVADKSALASWSGLGRIWAEPGAVQQYYPLTHSLFWLQYRLWGLHAFGYHAVNVLLHAANAAAAGALLQTLGLPAAWWAAALFAIHPVQVETVAWISELKNLLSTLLSLACLLAYWKARALPESGRRRRLFLLAFASYVAALMSKTVACTLPATLALLLWWKGAFTREDAKRLVPYLAAGLLFGLGTVVIERRYIIGAEDFERLTFAQRLIVAGRVPWFYAGKLLVPWRLCFNYPRWPHDPRAVSLWLPGLALLAVLAALWSIRRRYGRGAFCAAAVFLATLFPALGFFDVYPMRYSFVADHFQYAAALALLAPAAEALRRLPRAALYGTVLVLGVAGRARVPAFHDAEALWRGTLAANPASVLAANNLGLLLLQQDRLAESQALLTSATRAVPPSAEAWANLALLREKSSDAAGALAAYGRALEIEPKRYSVRVRRAGLLMERGDFSDACLEYGRAFDDGWEDRRRSSPRRRLFLGKQLAVVAADAGAADIELGRLDAASARLAQALALDSEQAAAHYHLARVSLRRGRKDEAAARLRRALALQPGFEPARDLLQALR